jgi:hypothetical protein
MTREQKIKYLNDIKEGKQPARKLNYSAMTLEELKRLSEIIKKSKQVDLTPDEIEFFSELKKKY